jgi:hypothetical protein
MEQILDIEKCKLKTIYMGRNFIFLCWGANQRIYQKKIDKFLIDRFWALSGYPCQEELLTMLQKKNPLQN